MKSLRRRGFSLLELMVSLWVLLFTLLAVLSLMAWGASNWHKTAAQDKSKSALYFAVQRMSPDIRSAYRVLPSTDRSRLTVVLPAEDGDGGYKIPLEDGQQVMFYQSDSTGDVQRKGDILWRAVDGVPDEGWSLRQGRGKHNLGGQNISFVQDLTAKAESVQFTLGSTEWDGKSRVTRSVSSVILLRNSQYR